MKSLACLLVCLASVSCLAQTKTAISKKVDYQTEELRLLITYDNVLVDQLVLQVKIINDLADKYPEIFNELVRDPHGKELLDLINQETDIETQLDDLEAKRNGIPKKSTGSSTSHIPWVG